MAYHGDKDGVTVPLMSQIVEALDEHGVMGDDLVLHDVVDVDALRRVMAIGSDLTVTFGVREVQLRVTSHGVTTVKYSREG